MEWYSTYDVVLASHRKSHPKTLSIVYRSRKAHRREPVKAKGTRHVYLGRVHLCQLWTTGFVPGVL